MGWLSNRLPACVAWLSNDVLACRDLAVVWLKRGARAPSRSLELGVPATVLTRGQEQGGEVPHGGGDDRCDTRSHVVSELVEEVWLSRRRSYGFVSDLSPL